MKLYYLFYTLCLIGFGGLVYYNPDLKSKIIGILCFLVNALMFWKG